MGGRVLEKFCINSPFSNIIHAVRLVPSNLSQASILLPNPKNFSTSSKNLLDTGQGVESFGRGHINCRYATVYIVCFTSAYCFPNIYENYLSESRFVEAFLGPTAYTVDYFV